MSRELLQQIVVALKALMTGYVGDAEDAIYAIEKELAKPEQEPISESILLELARRCLWIAYCWNDHNFDAAHTYARKEAKTHGIESFEEANDWLTSQGRKPWVGLTDDEIHKIINDCTPDQAEQEELNDFARAVRFAETKLKEKNNG
jgi:hypothetical protein